jgi:5'-nucleotidase/UDP-sugar diphosphatase
MNRRLGQLVHPAIARRILRASLLLYLTAACTPSVTVTGSAAPIRFLLINDVYVADTAADGSGGVARAAALRNSLAKQGPVVFALAGDFLSPSLLSKWYSGRQMLDALNAAQLDYVTFGNHEWELRQDTLESRIVHSRFRWTSANCTRTDGSSFPGVSRWDTTTIGGVKVGFFGTTLQGDYSRYVRCTDADSAAHSAIGSLIATGAQFIVGITHQNLETYSALLVREPRLDLILGGHEHEWHDVSVGGRHVVKADANARTAQVVTVSPVGGQFLQSARLDTLSRTVGLDIGTQRVIDGWQDSLRKRLGPERTIAHATAPIEGRDLASRFRESSLGDLVTDAIRIGTKSDVALLTSGTMRIDQVLPAGAMTNYELESIFLFADESHVVTFAITGKRVRELLEHSFSDGVWGHGGFAQLSGLHLDYSLARPSGQRISGPIRLLDGGILDDARIIQLSFGAFPACLGGDRYQVPEAAGACKAVASTPRTVDLLTHYLVTDLGGKVTPPPADRMIQRSN